MACPSFATVRAYKLGAVGTSDVSEVRCLSCYVAAQSHYMTLETPVGTDYVVPADHTFYITKIFYIGGADGTSILVGYGNDGVASGAAAPTTPVQLTQKLGYYTTATGEVEKEVAIPIPAGKYPYIQSVTSSVYVNIFGVEVAN